MLDRLDAWSAWIAQTTRANLHHFQRSPADYNHSEAYWRVLTAATILQKHFGVHYEPRLKTHGGWNWKDSRDVLLHGPLGPGRAGSCPSLPVLITTIGRRLGYPMHLVHAPAHVFSRWDGPDIDNPGCRIRFNIEYHGNGLASHADAYYRRWPVRWTPQVVEAERSRVKPLYLRSLEPAEALASFLCHRCHVLFEHRRFDECRTSALAARRFAPHDPMPELILRSLPGHHFGGPAYFPELSLQYAQWSTGT